MKFSVRHIARRDLTDTEKVGLRNVANGLPVDAALSRRLKKLGLAELNENVWATTQQGHVQLMFHKAR